LRNRRCCGEGDCAERGCEQGAQGASEGFWHGRRGRDYGPIDVSVTGGGVGKEGNGGARVDWDHLRAGV
jgi:hypothetical protein